MLDRQIIIQTLIEKKGFKNFLEIGVFRGNVFFNIKAKHKVAVDPSFSFTTSKRIRRTIKSPNNLFANFIEKTSDDFFAQDAPTLYSTTKVDISLIDGMHEYEFALRDVENTLKYLQPNGVIIMHDCNPQTPEAAVSFNDWKNRNFEGNWNGDVWKTIVYLRSLRKDINVFVLDCDHGLGIITWGTPENLLTYTPEAIEKMTYDDFVNKRKELLNLKAPEYFKQYFKI